MEVNINDFKLLTMECLRYFDQFVDQAQIDNTKLSKLSQNQRARYGFYFYMLEMVTGVSDLVDIEGMISDTEFNSHFCEDKSSDEGIDAVYINEEERKILLFNFKYREKYNPDQQQRKNELVESIKFLNDIQSRNFDHTTGKTRDFLESITQKFYDDYYPWSINLYFISNDTKSLDENDANVVNFKKTLDLKFKSICLEDIAKSLMSDHDPINAQLVMDNDALMSYKESKLSSDTSYIFRLSLTDLIRITCDDENFRNKVENYEKEELANSIIAYDVLSENVRGFILKSEYNKNITTTLETEPSKFFMFNNGITIIASDVKVTPFPSGTKSQVVITDLQVLNGGQTLRTIHNFNEKNKNSGLGNLQKAEILVRVFKVTDKLLMNRIAEFTNSQNAITNRDLKSISSDQIKLEKFLAEYGIRYIRKNGDVGNDKALNIKFNYTISMEKLGQILYAVKGAPENATNKKRAIFDTDYNRLFKSEELLSESTVEMIKDYFLLKKEYKRLSTFNVSEQKIYYLLYLKKNTALRNADIIRKFDKILYSYKGLGTYQQNRQMIKPQFKSEVDKEFGISN